MHKFYMKAETKMYGNHTNVIFYAKVGAIIE